MTRRAFLGIDGGGSTTTARLEDARGAELFERAAGPTNPQTTSFRELCRRFDDLLAGCPSPDALAVCLSGVGSDETRDRVGGYFHDRYPAAILRLEPDYAAALRCFDPEPSACVVAGTGSVVCSHDPDGVLVASGGTGYGLDPGSASRVGRALVARYVEDPGSVDELGPAIDDALGVQGHDKVVAAGHGAARPAALMARAAPLLCPAADEERPWARALVAAEMEELAALVAAHAHRHRAGGDLTVGLVGGVWTSGAARASFEVALRHRWTSPVTVVTAVRSPERAAVLLAREIAG